MNNAIVSGIRTLVAVLVAAVLTWLADHYGFHASTQVETTVDVIVFGLVTGAYTAAVNWLTEHVHPAFGWLLGIPKHPTYAAKASS